MRVLITGGVGFVGSSICITLSQKYPDYQGIAFDNLKRKGSEVNLSHLKNKNIEFYGRSHSFFFFKNQSELGLSKKGINKSLAQVAKIYVQYYSFCLKPNDL